ncbi:MAG: tetratricopeptide repeat-containing sensor histidine kinase [Opitutales bacterium]|nr:tetratricopeptide repeat-containing sensor histidine kinase [Opitutales bacterium]
MTHTETEPYASAESPRPEILAKVDALNDAAWEARTRDPGEAIQRCLEAWRLAVEARYADGEAYARSTLGLCHWIRRNYREALQEAIAARSLFEQSGNRMGLARTLNVVGLTFWHLGDYAHALEGFMGAHRIYREANHLAGMANQMGNIAAIRATMGEYDGALEAYRESIRIMEAAGNQHGLSDAVHNTGETLARTGQLEEAREYLQRAMDLKASISDWSGFLGSAVSTSQALLQLGRVEEAEACVDAAYEAVARLGLEKAPPHVRVARAQVVAERGDATALAGAIELTEGALADLREGGEWEVAHNAYILLSDLCERSGDTAKALRTLRGLVGMQRERFSEDSARQVRRLQVAFDVEQNRAAADEERRRREELDDLTQELRRLIEEKDAIMGTVSHDLQNPLGAILGFAGLLGEEPLTSEQKEYVRDIRAAANEMSSILGDLLRMNELDVRSGSADVVATDLAPLLAEMMRRYAGRARSKGIDLRVSGESADLTCLAEERSLRRVVDNLVSNAVKYTPKGGRVELTARYEGATVAFDVTDTGPGISEEERERLFRPFERLTAKPTGGEDSIGLGLHIARRLARSMGGDILCESAPGKGSTFTLYLRAPPVDSA